MKKTYIKNLREVEAIQYDGTIKIFNEIKEWIDEKDRSSFKSSEVSNRLIFNIICKTKLITVHNTEWIVKDGKHCFIVSNDIFPDFFTEK